MKREQVGESLASRYRLTWMVIAIAPLILQGVLLQDLISPAGMKWESPIGLFVLVVTSATPCIITSGLVLRRGVSTATLELIPAGLFFMAVSVLPLAHGITTPSVFYDDNTSFMATALWAIPVGVVAASPNLLPSSVRRSFLPRFWRQWLGVWLAVIGGLAFVSVVAPNQLPVHEPGGSFERAIALLSIVGSFALSYRQVWLAQIARNRGPLVIAAGYTFVAGSAAMWFGVELYSAGFWVAHLLDVAGVFAGTIGMLVVYRTNDDVRSALNPILVADPLSALELGLEPIVHTYVASIETKDAITRDHVVRTAELATLVGEELGYRGNQLRHISLVGLLHDVGKLDVPDAVLTKPGKLTDEEFAVMQRHAVDGANRVLGSVLLAPLSPGIRGHHERVDGNGYPDKLSGDAIPIESRIVAACDAYDAMANARQYRAGMGSEKAISILREHQGAQWDARVVDSLIRVLGRLPVAQVAPAINGIGRVGCDCLPEALLGPEDLNVRPQFESI